FVAQMLQLMHAHEGPEMLSPNTGAALAALTQAGKLDAAEGQQLIDTWRFLSDLQQALRICLEGDLSPVLASSLLKALLATIGHTSDFDALEQRLHADKVSSRAVFTKLAGTAAGRATE